MTPIATNDAWAAGLFEGEGTITLNGEYQSPRMKLSMTDADVVKRFHDIVGEGNLCVWKDPNGKYQQQLCWYTGAKATIERIIYRFLGLLGERRQRQAARALARIMNTPFEGWDTERVENDFKEFNR